MTRDEKISYAIAHEAWRIGAVGVSPVKPLIPLQPYPWTSGYQMPMYNDNRRFLGHIPVRDKIIDALVARVIPAHEEEDIMFTPGKKYADVIAGTATAGVPWASFVADRTKLPLVYVREKPKGHGLRNRIEGLAPGQDFDNKRVLLVEDVISTGGSSASAVQAIRDKKGNVSCVSLFTYGFSEANEIFSGLKAFDSEGGRLEGGCFLSSIVGYNTLIEAGLEGKYLTDPQSEMLAQWRTDPFRWGEKHGFPREIK